MSDKLRLCSRLSTVDTKTILTWFGDLFKSFVEIFDILTYSVAISMLIPIGGRRYSNIK